MSGEPIAAERLRSFIDRVERLHDERKAIAGDVASVLAEAKGEGFCTKTIKAVIKLRGMDQAERAEADALLDTYLAALGMLPEDKPSHVHVHTRGEGMDRATEGSRQTGSLAAESARKARPTSSESGSVSHAGAGESPADDGRNVEATGGAASVVTSFPDRAHPLHGAQQ